MMGKHAADFTDLELNEIVAEALEARRINWCRARLLHALAGAEKQDVLQPVIDELVPDAPYFAEEVHRLIAETLERTGWNTPGPPFDPSALTDAALERESKRTCWRRLKAARATGGAGALCSEIGKLSVASWCRACRSKLELERRRGG